MSTTASSCWPHSKQGSKVIYSVHEGVGMGGRLQCSMAQSVGTERGEELEPPKVSMTFFPSVTAVAPAITLTLTPRLFSTIVVSRGVHRTCPNLGSSLLSPSSMMLTGLRHGSLCVHPEDIS